MLSPAIPAIGLPLADWPPPGGRNVQTDLSPDCRALDWWLYKTILCIFEVVQGLHGFGSSCKLYNMTSSYSEVGIKAVCKSARHLDFQTSLAIVS